MFFWPRDEVVVLGDVCSVPPRRASRYPGTDVSLHLRYYIANQKNPVLTRGLFAS